MMHINTFICREKMNSNCLWYKVSKDMASWFNFDGWVLLIREIDLF